jgi:hypothetical protein
MPLVLALPTGPLAAAVAAVLLPLQLLLLLWLG